MCNELVYNERSIKGAQWAFFSLEGTEGSSAGLSFVLRSVSLVWSSID